MSRGKTINPTDFQKKSQKKRKKLLTNRETCAIINTESEVRLTTQNHKPSKQDRINILLNQLQGWIANGDTPEQALERLTVKQYDFLIDADVNLDNLILSPEQQKTVKALTRAPRTCKPGGYNKQYPQEKQDLYNAIVQYLTDYGAKIVVPEKQNFRDLDFTIDGKKYKIVLSNPRS